MALSDDVGRIASAAARFGGAGEEVVAVLAVETAAGERVYLCAFADAGGAQTWLVVDDAGSPVTSTEVAEEAAELSAEEPRLASLPYLDSLGGNGNLAGAIQGALPAVDELTRDVEANYRLELTS